MFLSPLLTSFSKSYNFLALSFFKTPLLTAGLSFPLRLARYLAASAIMSSSVVSTIAASSDNSNSLLYH